MILRQMLLSVSALAALTITASAADMPAKAPRLVEPVQQVSGYVELYGGWARTKQAFTDCDPAPTSGGARPAVGRWAGRAAPPGGGRPTTASSSMPRVKERATSTPSTAAASSASHRTAT